jgi:outer membrane immunogenic protein
MKKILLSAIATVVLSTSALAADLPARTYTKAPVPMIAPVYDWSGAYVGINGGGGSSHKCWDIVNAAFGGIGPIPPFSEGCHNATGGTVGGQIGYRWQRSAFVFGLEAQGNWANFQGNNPSLFGPYGNRSQIDAFGLFTGQIGYAIDKTLLYVKGGGAVTSDKYTGYDIPSGAAGDRATETRWGGVVGAGLEYAFASNWSFALEYDHMFMGTRDVSFYATGGTNPVPVGAFSRTDRIHQDVDLFTARLNYRFGGPIVARY